jgi:hypothetical protein
MTRCNEDGATCRYLSASAATSCRPAALTRPSDKINKSAGDETPIGEGELVDGLAAELRQMSTAPMDTAIAASELAPFLGELAGRASTVVVGQTRPPCSTG